MGHLWEEELGFCFYVPFVLPIQLFSFEKTLIRDVLNNQDYMEHLVDTDCEIDIAIIRHKHFYKYLVLIIIGARYI